MAEYWQWKFWDRDGDDFVQVVVKVEEVEMVMQLGDAHCCRKLG